MPGPASDPAPDPAPDPGNAAPDPGNAALDPAVAEDAAKLAGIFRWLAEVEFPGYSPLYEHLALHIADEPWIPGLITRHNQSSFAAVLFLDCVRELTLDDPDLPLARRYAEIVAGADPVEPDPWPLFREVVVAHQGELATLLETRSIQTNEVGRSAALLPAFEAVSRRFGRPLALIEIGCSAGLNLLFDQFHIDYGGAGSAGPPDSPVQLTCAAHGPLRPPIPTQAPRVISRLGIDINPVDVTDPIATRWLEACIWPDVPHRVERFRAALGLARLDPPEVRRGNAVDLVAESIRAVPDDAVACLDSTWVLAYFSDDSGPSCTDCSTSSAPTGPSPTSPPSTPATPPGFPRPPVRARSAITPRRRCSASASGTTAAPGTGPWPGCRRTGSGSTGSIRPPPREARSPLGACAARADGDERHPRRDATHPGQASAIDAPQVRNVLWASGLSRAKHTWGVLGIRTEYSLPLRCAALIPWAANPRNRLLPAQRGDGSHAECPRRSPVPTRAVRRKVGCPVRRHPVDRGTLRPPGLRLLTPLAERSDPGVRRARGDPVAVRR